MSRSVFFVVVLLLSTTPLGASPANPALVGANNEWVSPTVFFDWGSKGWQLQNWVNATDPLSSPALTNLLQGLNFGIQRYPGGSIGNWWDWRIANFTPQAFNCSLNSGCSYYKTMAGMFDHFPEHSFDVVHFNQIVGSSEVVLTLDVSTSSPAGPDPSIPALVARQLSPYRAPSSLRFEIGNEVYDPRQGPKPGGFLQAQDYLAATAETIAAVHKSGARAGVTLAPCPFFYFGGVNSSCWGGPGGRYHHWNQNISNSCRSSQTAHTAHTAQGAMTGCNFDAVIVHNYVSGVAVLRPFPPAHFLSVFLTLPQATMKNAVDSLRRDFPPGVTLWLTEYNTMYADVWYGKADNTPGHPEDRQVARFLNSTENSGAHGVQVAAMIIAAMAHGDAVELMNYHSLLDRSTTSQPGFAVTAINSTDGSTFISPVAQLMSLLGRLLSIPNCTMAGVDVDTAHTAHTGDTAHTAHTPPSLPRLDQNSHRTHLQTPQAPLPNVVRKAVPRLPFTLAGVHLSDPAAPPLPCVQASVICNSRDKGLPAASAWLIAINRCTHAVALDVEAVAMACFTGKANSSTALQWINTTIYNASLNAVVGSEWGRVDDKPPPWNDGPLLARVDTPANGTEAKQAVPMAPLALSITALGTAHAAG
jgi:hypothetical protein